MLNQAKFVEVCLVSSLLCHSLLGVEALRILSKGYSRNVSPDVFKRSSFTGCFGCDFVNKYVCCTQRLLFISFVVTIETMISENCLELVGLFISSKLPEELYVSVRLHDQPLVLILRFLKMKSRATPQVLKDSLNLVLEVSSYSDTQTDVKNRALFY
jgi:hypothetical protein